VSYYVDSETARNNHECTVVHGLERGSVYLRMDPNLSLTFIRKTRQKSQSLK